SKRISRAFTIENDVYTTGASSVLARVASFSMIKKISWFFPRSKTALRFHILILLSCSILLVAQEKKEKEPKGEKKNTENMIKVEGSVHCGRPEPAYSIEVPDRSGHALMLTHRKCTWTDPMVVLGAKTKDGVSVDFVERMEGTLHIQGFEVNTLDNGEHLTIRTMSQVL